ncbi:Cro/Cl family transcriptional regulator [Vibrio navarrensis]|uniref:LexA family transcriptional regulator n=1 Tax=Vibrio navarrensis TaxID=29495 RepID=A0AAJ4LX53_9VIBR|nr:MULTISPECIES: LexA family transcriptional regulator [Vibrio]KJR35906.1 Cro/Cl family transcriptional regulator [Vibrio sp. S234-5]MBE3662852.1 Cro/Cl family transcriptional regulator [Vibrio navarrensis]QPL56573.1 LexA family transcriptional regulator [Vibrio navarrensis]
MSLGGRIKKLREESLHISKKELSTMLGVSQSAVNQWENGVNYPSQKRLIELSRVLKTTYEWLVNGTTSSHNDGSEYEIPFYEYVNCSAGAGFINDSEESILVSAHFIPLLGEMSLDKVIALRVHGDSMEPAISDKGIVFVDTSDKKIIDGKVYVYQQEDVLRVKRLEYSVNGLMIKSYNDKYSDEKISKREFDRFCIIGRVLYSINRF